MKSQQITDQASVSTIRSRKPFFRFRFSLKFFLLVLTIVCAIMAWLANRIPHCRAVEKLQLQKVDITWERESPTWLDEKLGPWRFDRIKNLHYVGGPPLDLSAVNDLEYLGGFGTHEAHVPDLNPLLKHTATIRSLYLDSPPKNATEFYAKFHRLEDLGVFNKVDFAQLQHLDFKSITNYGVRELDVDAISEFKNLEYLNLSATNVRSLEKLAGLSRLHTLILYSCHDLKDVKGLDQLPALSHLEFDDCPNRLANLDTIGRCTELEILSLPAEVDLESIKELKKLRRIYSLMDVLDPDNLEVLGCFPMLEKLSLNWTLVSRFNGVELDLRLLKEKPNLNYLSVCRATHLAHLANFQQLESLHFRDTVITDADVILSLKHLDKITIQNCRISKEVHAALQAGKAKWSLARIQDPTE